jgi:hypothetical protein
MIESAKCDRARTAEVRRVAKASAGLKSPLYEVKDDRSLRYFRSGHTGARGVLCDPIPGLLKALVSTGFVVANGH